VLSPGLEVAAPGDWLVGALLVFAEALLWGAVGGALVVLPPLAAAFLAFARRAAPDGRGAHATLAAAAALWATLFTPLFALGLRGRVVDGLLLGLSLWIGVRRGLRELTRSLAPR
jgi:hypothetical protein